jgi:hypothetical protein
MKLSVVGSIAVEHTFVLSIVVVEALVEAGTLAEYIVVVEVGSIEVVVDNLAMVDTLVHSFAEGIAHILAAQAMGVEYNPAVACPVAPLFGFVSVDVRHM